MLVRETTLGVRAKIKDIAIRQASGSTSPDEDAVLDEQFILLAATYNDIMHREYVHRLAYKCQPDWKCRCPEHDRLGSACSHQLWQRMEYLDPARPGRSGNAELSAEWWAERGFKLVKSRLDPVLDWVVLNDGKLPIPVSIPEKAADWWVDFLFVHHSGHARPEIANDPFILFRPRVFDPIDWTVELKVRLRGALLGKIKAEFAVKAPPEAFFPLELSVGRFGGSILIHDACEDVGLNPPYLASDVSMLVTPASIEITHKLWDA